MSLNKSDNRNSTNKNSKKRGRSPSSLLPLAQFFYGKFVIYELFFDKQHQIQVVLNINYE